MAGAAPSTERRWRNVPLAREYDAPRGRRLWALLLGIAAAAAPLVFYVVQQTHYVQLRYRIEELRHRQGELLEAERRLRIEKASLETLPRVEARAREVLGLVRPGPGQEVVLDRGSPGRGALPSRSPGSGRRAR